MASKDPFGLSGTTINDTFDVREVVGEGGFGVVYRARHRGFDADVAIKCLKLPAHFSEGEKAAFFERLREEGKLLLKLSKKSAGIVQALDVGEVTTAAGTRVPYLALEWIEGRTLADELRRRRETEADNPTIRAAAELLEPIAAALATAHAQRVAHRDIKPDNVMLTADGDTKILDFGIAKLLETDASGAASTSAATPVFTPGYGAPEQFEKRRGATGPWTDVFSLALVFVEWTSGRRAIVGEELIDLYKVTTDPVRRPTLRALGVPTSDAVEAVLLRALAIEPKARFEDARAFIDALLEAVRASADADAPVRAPDAKVDTAFLASASTEAFLSRTDEGDEPAREGGTTKKEASKAPAAEPDADAEPALRTAEPLVVSQPAPARARSNKVVLALAGVGALGVVGWLVMREPPTPGAGAPAATATETAPLATASSSASAVVVAPTEPELGLRTVTQFHDAPAALAGNPLTTTAWRAAAESFDEACAADATHARWCAAADFCRGQIAFLRNENDEAARAYEAARDRDPSWALPHVGLANVWTVKKDLTKALEEAARAQKLEPSWWGAIAVGGRAYSTLGSTDGAIAEYRRALALAPDNASLLSEVALVYHAARMDTEALRTAERALELSPDLVHVRVLLAERAMEAKKGDEALEQAEKALAIAPRHVPSLLARADALNLLGRKADAMSAYEKAVETALASGGKTLEPDLEAARASLAKKELPALRDKRAAAAAKDGAPSVPARSRPAPTCRCSPGDPLCSCL